MNSMAAVLLLQQTLQRSRDARRRDEEEREAQNKREEAARRSRAAVEKAAAERRIREEGQRPAAPPEPEVLHYSSEDRHTEGVVRRAFRDILREYMPSEHLPSGQTLQHILRVWPGLVADALAGDMARKSDDRYEFHPLNKNPSRTWVGSGRYKIPQLIEAFKEAIPPLMGGGYQRKYPMLSTNNELLDLIDLLLLEREAHLAEEASRKSRVPGAPQL